MDRYQSLVPILPFQPGVCSFCHQSAVSEERICSTCNEQAGLLGLEMNSLGRARLLNGSKTAIATCLPIFLRLHRGAGYYSAGYEYKSGASIDAATHRDAQMFMSSILKMALSHEKCIAKHLSMSEEKFGAVTWIPSKRERVGTHPLEDIIRSVAGERVQSLLTYNGEKVNDSNAHVPRSDMWKVASSSRIPRTVLVIDDTWTKGSSLLSAAHTLLSAGVERVGLLPLGRHTSQYGTYKSPGHKFEEFSQSLKWQGAYCALCDTRAVMRAEPNLLSQYQEVIGNPQVENKPSVDFDLQDNQKAEIGRRVHHSLFGIGKIHRIGPAGNAIAIDFGTYGIQIFPEDDRALEWL